MGDAGHAGGEVVVQEIVNPIDEGNAGDEGEGTGDDRQEGGPCIGKVHGEIGSQCGSESRSGNRDVAVDFQLCADIFHNGAGNGGQKGVERIHRMAAEDEAECGRSHADGQDDHPFRINAVRAGLLDMVQMGHKPVIRRILVEGIPGSPAGLEHGSHIDAVAVAFSKHGMRVFSVIHINHNGGVGQMNLHILPVNTKVGGSFQHIPDDTLAAGTVFHQKLPRVQDQLHLIPDGEVISIYIFQYKPSFIN